MTDPIITTTDLTRLFGDTVAVDHLSLDVQPGEIFGFLGHNGAGKTTTIRMLNGVLTATGGSAHVLGLDPLADGPALRRRTGVLTETPSLDERLTGRENLRYYATLYDVPKAEVDRRVAELLDSFDLADRGGDKVGGYSKGMKQRLALARALVHKPDLLFLDEPTAGLDPLAARHVHEMVSQMARTEGGTVFLTTHNLVEAEKLFDLVGVIHRGSLRAIGSPAQLARELWHNTLIEIDLKDPPDHSVKQAVQNQQGVVGLEIDGSQMIVEVSDLDVTPSLVQAVVAAGGQIYGVRKRDHGLEDVYFALDTIERADAQPGGKADA